MEAIIIHPKNKKQLTALKTIFTEMKIPFEKAKLENSPYNPKFVEKVKRGEAAAEKGDGLKVNIDTLWK